MSEKRINVWVQRFPDRRNLVLQWIDPDTGRRRSRSARTSKAEGAEKARADLEYELNHGQYQEPSKLDWDRFRELFEAEYLPELVMGEDAPAEQVDGERLADRRAKVSALGSESFLDFRRQVDGKADVHRIPNSSSSDNHRSRSPVANGSLPPCGR